MCDTMVALGSATADGAVIVAKNSDREPNEAHHILVIPAADHIPDSLVKCTYIEVPQAAHTFAVLLAKPFWIWGAEMGMNEHGVSIGNEAIFTRVPYEKTGLTGMDLIRLALERSRTAFEAMHTITRLLETYGQGGNCGFTHGFYYHNSFILADLREAWVLETAGRQWVAEKVRDIRSISNAATIGSEWDLASADLVRYAVDRGWCKGRDDFNFTRCYSDFLYTRLSDARRRQVYSTDLLRGQKGGITPSTMMWVLRSHGTHVASEDQPLDRSILGATVCMHAGAGPVRNSQSVGSLVAHLAPGLLTAWVTCTSAPCTGIFKPVWLDAGYPLNEPQPNGQFDSHCLWWRHERLHRAVLKDYDQRIQTYAAQRDALEARFLDAVDRCPAGCEERRNLSRACFERAEEAEAGWFETVRATPVARSPRFYYASAWKAFHRQAGLD